MMQLLDLNDDCLAYICGFLHVNDQLTVKHVCLRFDNIITSLWRQRKTIALNPNHLEVFDAVPADFVELFADAKPVLEKVRLRRLTSQHLKLLQHLTFPNVKYLEVSNWQNDMDSNDRDMLLLVKLFPAIHTLLLLSNITGKYISGLRHLVHLDLSCCADLESKYLAEIYKCLKLKTLSILFYDFHKSLGEEVTAISACSTLESLTIEDFHLVRCIDEILELPRMRKIHCFARDHDERLMNIISLVVGPRIKTMVYSSLGIQHCEDHLESLFNMTNLQRLVFYADSLKTEQMHELALHLRYLREFHFISGCLENEDSLLYFLQYCKYLEVLNVSHSTVSVDVLKKIIEYLNSNKRTQSLQLYCIGTEIANTDLEDLEIPKQLEVVTKKHVEESSEETFFDCEWRPKVL